MLAAVAAVLLAVAAGTGWLLYQGHARHALAQNRSHQTLAHPGGQGSGPQPLTQTAVSSSPAPSSPVSSPAPSSPAASSPDGSPSPAGSETGSSVALAPQVLAYGSAHRVGAFVSRYFTTINDRNYRVYTTLYVPGAQPIATESEFKSGYRTTTDSHARLFGLSPTAGGGWAARVSFVSHQDSTQSRTGTSCTAWRITFFLVPSGRSYQIVSPPAGYRSTSRACRAA
jgi:hypothetical protein